MSEAFLGEIRIFTGSYAPANWHLCDGSLVNLSQYQALFALIGTQYGGDGVSTFGLPDLRGRAPIHQGLGPGLTARTIAQKGGNETVSLTDATMPSHTHLLAAMTDAGTTAKPDNTMLLANTTGMNPGGKPLNIYQTASKTVTTKALNTSTISSSGSGAPHDNVMPSLPLNYIICTIGLYPTQS